MTKLYVTNLSQTASLGNLRQCFAACGEVVDVEMVPERGAYHSTSSAYVRMSTQAAAERAAASLQGTILLGRSLVISHAPEEQPRGRKRDGKDAEPASNARITQQYRERLSMTYELSCHSARLTVRIFFTDPEQPSRWRIEASTAQAGCVAEATDASRELALRGVADAWAKLPSGAPELDWAAIAAALKAVRAV